MAFTVNWTISGDVGPGGLPQNGTSVAEALERISVVVPSGGTDTVSTGIADIAALRFLVLAASRPDGTTFRVGGGPAVSLPSPVLLSGELAQMLGATAPSLIEVNNTGADDLTVELLICRNA